MVSKYVTNNADFSCWESVRENYGAYSYLAFLCLAVKSLTIIETWSEIKRISIEEKIENKELLEEISKITLAEQFVSDFLKEISEYDQYDISNLYQEYLSVDFVVKNNSIIFDCGKNGRDVLGSYYTQYDFAKVITDIAFNDYFSKNDNTNTIKIVDYSCGGAIFLIAAVNACKKRHISANIYGYDVDPIAVLISRILTIPLLTDCDTIKISIRLGNPLLPLEATCKEKFRKAITGRYYNKDMGINPTNDADIVLGNPPWEKIRFEEKKFLHHFFPESEVSTKKDREKLINQTSRNNYNYYEALSNDYIYSKSLLKKSPLFTESCCGELNTYALFTELCREMINPHGVASIIVKSSLVKMPVYSNFFKSLTSSGDLYKVYMFNNNNKIFNIDSREEFSVIYISRDNSNGLRVALDLSDYKNLALHDTITLTTQDLTKLNPDTKMIPNIKSNDDLQFLLNLYNHNSSFGTVYEHCHYGRLVHLTNHSSFIRKSAAKGYLAIYEGKFIEQYTSKYASFGQMDDTLKYKNKATARLISNPQGNEYPEARFYIKNNTWNSLSKNFHQGYVIAWRSLTSATNKRTMLATLLPLIPTCQSIQILQLNDERQMLHVLALFNSIVFDFIVRRKMVGLDLTQTIIKQIPVPRVCQYDDVIKFKEVNASFSTHIISRLKALYADDIRVIDIFKKFDLYDVSDTRKKIIADMDTLFGLLYGIDSKTLKDIAYSFGSYYSKEEVASLF